MSVQPTSLPIFHPPHVQLADTSLRSSISRVVSYGTEAYAEIAYPEELRCADSQNLRIFSEPHEAVEDRVSHSPHTGGWGEGAYIVDTPASMAEVIVSAITALISVMDLNNGTFQDSQHWIPMMNAKNSTTGV